jgi:ABC-type sugar transport system ATPase subunit
VSQLRVEGLRVAYADRTVLPGVSLTVPSGSCFALLGASGGGKSTLLLAIAGLIPVRAGRIFLGDDEISRLPPERRRVGMVFQSYALFPGMSALDNIAFGARQQGASRAQARALATEWGQRLGLTRALQRPPGELSGGEQQRVALARALAARPRLLLMDEPLSNIDPALRQAVRVQLRELRASWGVTTVLVTHDREDAFWLADRMGLLRDGALVQTGEPSELYRQPVDRDAAELLGPVSALPACRWADGRVQLLSASDLAPARDSGLAARAVSTAELASALGAAPPVPAGAQPCWALLRAEEVRFSTAQPASAELAAIVEAVVDLGAGQRALCRLADGRGVWASQLPAQIATNQRGAVQLPQRPWTVPWEAGLRRAGAATAEAADEAGASP